MKVRSYPAALSLVFGLALVARGADGLMPLAVEAQPLAANIERVVAALELLGAPLASELRQELAQAALARDAVRLQTLLDARVLLAVHINPEARVKVARGPAAAELQQSRDAPVLVKVVNESGGTQRLRIGSAQAFAADDAMGDRSHGRPLTGTEAGAETSERRTERLFRVRMFDAPPMLGNLSGLEVEYAIALLSSTEAGKREATITFDVGQGTQDLGFRAEVPVLFSVRPATRANAPAPDELTRDVERNGSTKIMTETQKTERRSQ